MKVKSFIVTARPSAREQVNRSLDTAVDAAVQKFLSVNPGIKIDEYEIAADFGGNFEKAFVSIVYEEPSRDVTVNRK